ARRGARADLLAHVELAVAVRVMQRDDAAARLGPAAAAAGVGGDVEVAVRRDGHVPRRADVVRDDQRTESLRQRGPAVVGVAGDLRLTADADRQRRDCRARRQPGASDSSYSRAHDVSPVRLKPDATLIHKPGRTVTLIRKTGEKF